LIVSRPRQKCYVANPYTLARSHISLDSHACKALVAQKGILQREEGRIHIEQEPHSSYSQPMQLDKERYSRAARNESNKAHAKGMDGGGEAILMGVE
jgi:hypothetical protein